MGIQQTLNLFKIYQKLADIVKEKSAGGAASSGAGGNKDKKGKGRPAAAGQFKRFVILLSPYL